MTSKREHISSAQLVGRLGQAPELQHTDDGTPYVRLSIATSESFTAKNGVIQDKTEWHQAVAWREKAEEIATTLAKGDSVVLEGDLRVNSYETEGAKNRVTELHIAKAQPNRENEPSRNSSRLVGEVREAPVVRHFDSGAQMTTLSIATRTMAEGKDGPREREDWHRVTLWGKTAEAARDINAGDTVAINGSLRHRTVPGENGQERKLSAIECHKFQILERAPERQREALARVPPEGLSASGPGASSAKPRERSRTKGTDRGI